MREVAVFLLGALFASALLTAYRQPDTFMPRVVLKSSEEINREFCPDGGCLNTVALYNNDTKTITVNENLDPTKEYDISVLLHEFIHHLQNINGHRRSDCSGEREGQAYTTQRAFLKSRGDKDTSATMGVDAFTELLISQCHYR